MISKRDYIEWLIRQSGFLFSIIISAILFLQLRNGIYSYIPGQWMYWAVTIYSFILFSYFISEDNRVLFTNDDLMTLFKSKKEREADALLNKPVGMVFKFGGASIAQLIIYAFVITTFIVFIIWESILIFFCFKDIIVFRKKIIENRG